MHKYEKLLLDTIKSDDLTPEKKLIKVKSVITAIQELNKIKALEEDVDKKFITANSDVKIEPVEKLSLDAKDANGDTALILAANNGFKEIVQALIAANANVNEKNNYGDTALMSAAAYKGDKEIVQALIAANANVNEKNNYGDTALMCAAGKGDKEIVQALIEANANVNEKNNDGETALMYTAVKGDKEIVQALIAANANVDEKNNNGTTALMICAAAKGHKEMAQVLVLGSADLEITNKDNKTALDIAIENRDLAMVSLLLSHDAKINNFDALREFLSTHDQQDVNMPACLKALNSNVSYKIRAEKDTAKDKHSMSFITEQMQQEKYIEKLSMLYAVYRNLYCFNLDDSTPDLPTPVKELIYTYDGRHFQARSSIVFFQPATVDTALRELDVEVDKVDHRSAFSTKAKGDIGRALLWEPATNTASSSSTASSSNSSSSSASSSSDVDRTSSSNTNNNKDNCSIM